MREHKLDKTRLKDNISYIELM